MAHRGRLQNLPAPLRPLVAAPLDLLRRTARRTRSTFRRLAPRRIAATARWLWALFLRHWRLRHEEGLRVAVDVDPLWLPLTGVGWYLRMVLEELADQPDLHLRLYGPWLQGAPEQPSAPLPTGSAIDLVEHPLDDDLTLPPSWQNRLLRLLQPMLVRFDRNQVVFAPNFIVPRRLRWAGGQLVVTVHDLAMRKFEWTLSEGTKELLDRDLDHAITTAERIITPSETVRSEIVDDGLFDGRRVHAVLHGPGHLAPSRSAGEDGALRLPEMLLDGDRARPYVVHVGTIEPRKNLGFLLDVWQRWVDEEGPSAVPRLVWCGGVGWKSEELLQRAESALEAGWLVRPGYVPDDELADLYRASVCAVMPSHYEGFGLPLVEAMSAGAPVVCSAIPVFEEVVGRAGLLLPLDQPEEWRETVRRLSSDAPWRQQWVARGRERTAELSWQRSASETLGVWRLAAGGSTR